MYRFTARSWQVPCGPSVITVTLPPVSPASIGKQDYSTKE
jgi:hypothetical protein